MSFDRPCVSRRGFLSGLAAGAAAAGCGAWTRPAPGAACDWTMRLSCSTINFVSLPIEEACQRISALGFEAIDIWGPIFKCKHLDEVVARLGPTGLQELLAKNKLKLYAFSVYGGGYRRYAELLGKVGGGVAVRGSAGPCDPKDLTARMKAFLESLKPDLELAEKHNSYLAVENHGHALLDSLDSFKAFAELNRNPRLGIAMAPYHLQSLKVSVPEAIAVTGPQLFFFYAWQQARDEQQMPGIGPTDCTPWIAALAHAKYRWYVNPFMHHEPAPEAMSKAHVKSIAYLKSCYAKACGGK